MFKQCTVTLWKGIGKRNRVDGSSTEWLLNTRNMYNIQADGSNAKLYFVDNKYGLKSHGDLVKMNETVASLQTAFDVSVNANYISIPVYPSDDTSESTVSRMIPVEDMSRAYADPQNTYRSYVWYSEGEKEVRVLTSYSLLDLYSIIVSGAVTTSTTSS